MSLGSAACKIDLFFLPIACQFMVQKYGLIAE